jgi:hypothetical protein
MLQNPVSLPPNLERETVARTRAMIYRRSWVLALALFFTALPFTFALNSHQLTWLALRHQPAFLIFWVVAGFFWLDYVLLGRRLRVR